MGQKSITVTALVSHSCMPLQVHQEAYRPQGCVHHVPHQEAQSAPGGKFGSTGSEDESRGTACPGSGLQPGQCYPPAHGGSS